MSLSEFVSDVTILGIFQMIRCYYEPLQFFFFFCRFLVLIPVFVAIKMF